MSTLPARGPRRPAPPVLLLALALLAPRAAAAAPQVVALRDTPSSLSARYGAAIPLEVGGVPYYVIPSGTGCEIRLAGTATADSLVSSFRAAGSFTEAAASGSMVYLMGGARGVAAVDLADPAAPAAAGSYETSAGAEHGAYAPASRVLAVASGSTLAFLAEASPGQLSLLQERTYSDGREITRIAARGDSFLVAARRVGGLSRLFLTLYRARAGAAPESLWDFEANGHDPVDLSWQGDIAFLADNYINGIQPFHLPTRTLRPATAVIGGSLAALAADSVSLVVAYGTRQFAQFTRAGSLGDSLIDKVVSLTTLDLPVAVSLISGHAIIATDSQPEPPAPDEVARSAIEDRDLALGVTSPPIGNTGRVRRVAQSGGYAYVADYSGGLRIYRTGGSDSTLVGVLPALPNGNVYDLALDPARHLAFLASGSAGVEIVDVTDPSSPQRVGAFSAPGIAYCVALAGPTLLAAGWVHDVSSAGVTFVDVSTPGAPAGRGSASEGAATAIADPRSLAVKDTVLFVADSKSGVISVGFGNPDAPAIFGHVSGVLGTVDVNVQGNTLLAATSLRGVQVVDVSQPATAILRGEVPLPPVYGVTQQGSAAVAFLGPEGAAVLDLTAPSNPVVRGPIYVPGLARAGAWTGDTLLVAATLGLERFRVSPLPAALPVLSLSYDDASGLPRVVAGWPADGGDLVLYRDRLDSGASATEVLGVRVNALAFPAGTTGTVDGGIQAGATYRYRLERVSSDGSSVELSEGAISIPSGARLGRPYPNPFRAGAAAALTIPFRAGAAAPGTPVVVRVFDVKGRLVRGLAIPAAPSGGFGAAVWNGKDDRGVPAASGLYVVHVLGPGIDDSKGVVLVR